MSSGGSRPRSAFKGSVLVNTLMEHDARRFPARQTASKFGQRLLDVGQIESVSGHGSFTDSPTQLYCWSDESVVREARRMAVTTTSRLPPRRLIQLVDLQQDGQPGQEGYDMGQVRRNLQSQFDNDSGVERLDPSGADGQNGYPALDGLEGLDSGHLARRLSSPALSGHQHYLAERGLLQDTTARQFSSAAPSPTPASPLPVKVSHSVPGSPGPLSAPNMGLEQLVWTDQLMDVHQTPTLIVGTPSMVVQDLHDTTTCKYDGVEMAALDLENLDLSGLRVDGNTSVPLPSPHPSARSTPVPTADQVAAQSTEQLHQEQIDQMESHGYSDNEKHLIEQMKKMRKSHDDTVETYEERITQLTEKVKQLGNLAELLESGKLGLGTGQPQATAEKEEASQKQPSQPSTPRCVTPADRADTPLLPQEDVQEDVPAPGVIPAAPPVPGPPAPPPPPSPSRTTATRINKPSKPAVQPRVKMRALFWDRVILDRTKENYPISRDKTFWHNVTEPNFDVDEFERFFGVAEDVARKETSYQRQDSGGVKQVAKVLEQNRSRALAIKLRSIHCCIEDVRKAVYSLQNGRLDAEGLHDLYNMRATPTELQDIRQHQLEHAEAPLDIPEQFLLQLAEIQHFAERVECLQLQKHFNEAMFNIDEQLNTVQHASNELQNNESVRNVLELILAFGNYMNGGTQRGQADGFSLQILTKLKDVRSTSGKLTLLQYVVRVQCQENEPDAGTPGATFNLPPVAMLQQAGAVNITDLQKELSSLRSKLTSATHKAELVYLAADTALLQPFKDTMDDFFESAEDLLSRQEAKYRATQQQFHRLLTYLAIKPTDQAVTPASFFGTWATFCTEYYSYWQDEQKRIAKAMFERVEQSRKARLNGSRRRRARLQEGKADLKQKFAQIRRRSETSTTPNASLLRSQSLSDVGEDGADRRGGPAAHGADRPRSRTMSQSEADDVTSRPSGPQRSQNSSVDSTDGSMGERMRRRRRTVVAENEPARITDSPYNSLDRASPGPCSPVFCDSQTMREHIQQRRRRCASNVEGMVASARPSSAQQVWPPPVDRHRAYSPHDSWTDTEDSCGSGSWDVSSSTPDLTQDWRNAASRQARYNRSAWQSAEETGASPFTRTSSERRLVRQANTDNTSNEWQQRRLRRRGESTNTEPSIPHQQRHLPTPPV